MARKRDKQQFARCRQIKRSDAVVVWDPVSLKSNRAHIREHGISEREVESVLLNDDSEIVPNHSHPEHCLVFGFTDSDRFIAVVFEIVAGKPLAIRPITAFEPNK
jgi:uncharacterized DUF497 family protein